LASGQMTITSQQRGLPSCHGIRDRPSGLLPFDLDRPLGYLVTGMPADTNARATSSSSSSSINYHHQAKY